ncbi:putative asparagine synthetase [Besnoitia besnoiti]|uniref:asparagine synthase (glutamine-hydrolyzing) n=1 Tax=Besnoitia besnoiti TaxID=94643 RepID=A0A2A9MBG3_BESBE|nr:putative asparagine synthetase [Besnoitia besnoiti]PFH32730.1 putative asparagine synthetase [Besnoitia besnoiti]
MCGILAILMSGLDYEQLRQLALSRSRLLRHRGPDWNGVHLQQCSASLFNVLCHERLAVVDPASGKQPLFDSTKSIACTVNGEIYNHVVLKETMLPVEEVTQWTTCSDCQPLPSLYKFHGTKMCNMLDGMFAFVISDGRTGDFLAARDPLGLCPMYVGYASDGSMWFASELKALTRDCEQVTVFPPGHFYSSKLNEGKGGFERYYNPSWWGLERPLPTRKCDLSHLREALEAAVRKRLMCDVPFGMLVSGRLDSSIVAAIAAREFQKMSEKEKDSHLWTHQLYSFSIGLKGSADSQAAKKVADVLGTHHYDFTFELDEGLDALDDVIYMIETYDITTVRAAVPMYLLCRLVKSMGIKVVLTGEGADEVFGGYSYFRDAPTPEAFHRELQRKLDLLHYYGILRAGKASMAWGIEARVPFLDREFLEFAMNVDPADKMCAQGRMEKQILRDAFKGYLPDEILYRPKQQFGEAVGSEWIDELQNHAERRVTDTMMRNAQVLFPTNTPVTKEGYLYRMIFAKHYNKGSAARTVHTGPFGGCSSAQLDWNKKIQNNGVESAAPIEARGIHQHRD